jgi:hypothetical protein
MQSVRKKYGDLTIILFFFTSLVTLDALLPISLAIWLKDFLA